MNSKKTYIAILIAGMGLFTNNCLAQKQVYRIGTPRFLPFPTETVDWQRDVYREVRMTREQNIGLFYGCEGKNLFLRIFDVIIQGTVKSYAYQENMDMSSQPNSTNDLKRMLKDYNIRFSERGGRLIVDGTDIPSDMIMSYYIKEAVFYDVTNSMFRTQVVALCPILEEDDEYEGEKLRYPLFWVDYKEIEPYIQDLKIFPDSRNIYSRLPIVDYFARNMYRGSIIKVFNPANITLPQYCNDMESMDREQKRIEQELVDVKRNTYNTFHK